MNHHLAKRKPLSLEALKNTFLQSKYHFIDFYSLEQKRFALTLMRKGYQNVWESFVKFKKV
ncbi:CLUMA_CG012546, isoform A [Clunio marinus]|uniref:CLUMA_CG012546, isoform A n=1 Tax=Clunio marinus TaxID=568069 RepID=A0A1J1IG06_9DIPT|nr:CLUMA_CG012546, isoform A [Clunio marinus]